MASSAMADNENARGRLFRGRWWFVKNGPDVLPTFRLRLGACPRNCGERVLYGICSTAHGGEPAGLPPGLLRCRVAEEFQQVVR